MLLTSGFPCSNGNSLTGGGELWLQGFDVAPGWIRADACLLGCGYRLILNIDRVEAALGDAKRHRSVFDIASSDRERAGGRYLLQEASANEFIDSLSGSFAVDVRRQFNPAIIAVRTEDKRTK
jgi:hypothetical protein